MSANPFVGLPSSPGSMCGYGGADIDQPGCEDPSRHHILSRSAAWGLVTLRTCHAHRLIALRAGEALEDHGFTDRCLDEQCWDIP